MSTGYESNYPASGYASESQIRQEFEKIQDALEDTISRSGQGNSSGDDNTMYTHLDMGGNSIINTGSIDASSIIIDGIDLYEQVQTAVQAAVEAGESADEAAQSVLNAAQQAGFADVSRQQTQDILDDFRNRYYGAYSTAPSNSPTGDPIDKGDMYFDLTNNYLMIWGDTPTGDEWKFAGLGPKGDKGDKGDTGSTGVFVSATSEGLNPGANPTVTMGGTPEARTIHFGIPKGNTGSQGIQGPQGDSAYQVWVDNGGSGSISDFLASLKGDQGAGATITSASASSVPYGTPPSVTLGGTPGARTFLFTIPEGKQGDQGPQGPQGIRGASFSVDKVGNLNELSNYDNEDEGFVFFAQDVTIVDSESPVSETFSYSATNQYTLTDPVQGEQVLLVFVNNIFQSDSAYSISVDNNGIATVDIVMEDGDTLHVREIGVASIYGAVFFKLSNASGDWSDAVPFGRGPQGETGPQGIPGNNGQNGLNGADGISAYQTWLDNGNSGSEQVFLQSLRGSDGAPGAPGTNGVDGKSAHEIWVQAGNIGDEEDFLNSLKGATGPAGVGLSAYDLWLLEGNTGSEQDFLDSLKGADGVSGVLEAPNDGNRYIRKNAEWVSVEVTLGGDNSNALASAETEIIAGTGLVGGGDLTANRTIQVAQGVSTNDMINMDARDTYDYAPGKYVQTYLPYAQVAYGYPVEELGFLEVVMVGPYKQLKYTTDSARTFLCSQGPGGWSDWKELVGVEEAKTMASGVVDEYHIGEIVCGPFKEIRDGWLNLDGSRITENQYPKLYEYIVENFELIFKTISGPVNNTPDVGYFVVNASSEIYLPKMDGLFVRGVGGNADPTTGRVQSDAIRNIVGTFHGWTPGGSGLFTRKITGAFGGVDSTDKAPKSYHRGYNGYQGISFNASKTVPTANENRPVNVAWRYQIKAE